MPSPKRIRLRDLRKSPGFVTHEQLASVIDAVVLIDEQTGGGGGGSSWFDGAGTPSSGLGVNGDYYLNTSNGDVYEKAGGTWTLVGNIKGPAGTNGTNGVGVPVAGTAGQILAKIDATNYNTEWIDNFTSQVKHEVKAGVALTKGQAVYVSGSTGGSGTNMIVLKSDNTTESQSSKTMGLIAQDLAVNGFGFVITEGLLAGLDTSAAGAAGDPVWLGTNGNLLYGISNKPSAPAHMVFIGIVTRKQSVNGEIFVNVQNGFELQELHNVAISSVANAQLLMYESATFLWKNKTLAQIITEALGNGTSGQLLQTDGSGGFTWQNIPDASDVMKGLVSISNQTFAGIKSFSNGTSAGEIRLFEPSGSGVHWVALKSQAMAADYSITLPAAAPTGAQYLQSTGVGGVLQWTSGTTTGVSSIGTINSATKNPNGAVISGSNIIMQTADANNVGLMSIGTQTFAGAKTFQAQVNVGNASYVSAILAMGGTTSNLLSFPVVGNSVPTNGLTPLSGTKIVIYPSQNTATTDSAIGFSTTNNEMWFSSNQAGSVKISFYLGPARYGYWGNASNFLPIGLHIGDGATTGFLQMNSSTSNLMYYVDAGVGAPSNTSSRSAGSKIVIKNGLGNASTDYAIGYNTNEMWFAVPSSGVSSFYSIATRFARFGTINFNTGLHLGETATGGYLGFLGTTSNMIFFGDGGVAAPTVSSTRSLGYKIILKNALGNGSNDYGIGFNTDELWFAGGSNGGDGKVSFYLGSATPRVTIGLGFLNLVSGYAYRVNNLQVLGARITGWSAPTATQLRSALTNSSTATDVLQTLSALIVDLRTHGLINN